MGLAPPAGRLMPTGQKGVLAMDPAQLQLKKFHRRGQSQRSVRHLDTMPVLCLPVGHLLSDLQSRSHLIVWTSGLLSQVSPSNHHPWCEDVLSTKDEHRFIKCRPA